MRLNDSDELARVSSGFLLLVKTVGGQTRYLVKSRGTRDGHGDRLIGSGTAADTRTAMVAAEMHAARARAIWGQPEAHG